MADHTQPRYGALPYVQPEQAVTASRALGRFTNLAGAAVSLVLVAGVGVWGYKLLVRDVSGIPVVRAAAGEMRVRPEVPGGQMAAHQGLSVNTVAAVGTADDLAEQLRLAPQPTELAEEDQPMAQIEEAYLDLSGQDDAEGLIVDAQAQIVTGIAAALESGSVDTLVAELTDGVDRFDPLDTDDESAPVLVSASSDTAAAVLSGPDMTVSLRPALRPATAPQTTLTPSAPQTILAAAGGVAGAPDAAEVDAATLPVGTRLVQLGAFDTPDIARAQWGALNARFAPFMQGKTRIVMEAKSGGRTFYRLRAQGFEDIGDARRFCSALVAESVDCIPVVSR